MERPLAIDLCTGLHGWAEGLVAEGYRVIGFDLENMCAQFGQPRPEHVQLVIQDILTLHGSQFKSAALIVASPPCQKYSYMAMPWKKAKAQAVAIRADKTGEELERLNRLFNACLRIQREASEAAGRRIPMVIENVRGAEPWIGRARWNFGSFYLWGDVPALMPVRLSAAGVKAPGMNWSDQTKRGQDFTRIAGDHAIKVASLDGGRRTDVGKGARFTSRDCGVEADGLKLGGSWFHGYRKGQGPRNHGSKSKARKMASAMIAKIPLPLSRHIAATWHPDREQSAA